MLAAQSRFRAVFAEPARAKLLAWLRQIWFTASSTRWRKNIHAKKAECDAKVRDGQVHKEPRDSMARLSNIRGRTMRPRPGHHFTPANWRSELFRSTGQKPNRPLSRRNRVPATCKDLSFDEDCERDGRIQIRARTGADCYGMRAISRNSKSLLIWVSSEPCGS